MRDKARQVLITISWGVLLAALVVGLPLWGLGLLLALLLVAFLAVLRGTPGVPAVAETPQETEVEPEIAMPADDPVPPADPIITFASVRR